MTHTLHLFLLYTDGPYGLQVNSDKGLKVGEVFTVDLGEAILFDCSADSYPPNTYSWIRRSDNTTYVIKHGPRLEVASEKVAQKTTDYVCCAYNNVTGRRDETHFTVIITSVGKCVKGQPFIKHKSMPALWRREQNFAVAFFLNSLSHEARRIKKQNVGKFK